MVALLFKMPPLNRQSTLTVLSPLVPPNQSSLTIQPFQAVFEPTHQLLWSSPIFFVRFISSYSLSDPPDRSSLPSLTSPSHFRTNTPSVVSHSCLFHQIIWPSKPFLNQHSKYCEPVPSFSSDYLPLQAIFEPTRQALWAKPVFFIIFISSDWSLGPLYQSILTSLPLQDISDRHANPCETVPSFLIRFIIHQWLL